MKTKTLAILIGMLLIAGLSTAQVLSSRGGVDFHEDRYEIDTAPFCEKEGQLKDGLFEGTRLCDRNTPSKAVAEKNRTSLRFEEVEIDKRTAIRIYNDPGLLRDARSGQEQREDEK